MEERRSLQGWAPEIGRDAALADVVEAAFDYRGDVTIAKSDGTEVVGYLFNRDGDAAEPFVEVLDSRRPGTIRLRYAEIRSIRFTGRDPVAAGPAFAPWLERSPAPSRKG
jgi:hypothetical protein